MERQHVAPQLDDTTSLLCCQQCQKQYKRPEHLLRHLSSHSSERPYQCHICKSATFQRSDVLKRHARTCIGPDVKRPKVAKACDHCMKSKRACDTDQPCANCRRKGVSCTYYAAAGSELSLSAGTRDLSEPNVSLKATADCSYDEWLYFDALDALASNNVDSYLGVDAARTPSWPKVSTEAYGTVSSLKFLESITRNKGLIASFDCGNETQRILARATFASRIELQREATLEAGLQDELSPRSQEIVDLVVEVVKVRPRNSAVTLSWSDELMASCADLFSPDRLRLFLELYWAIWHPNVNMVHRPTFDPTTAKACLIAAMAILGASVSPEDSDREAAQTWYSCIEELVFRDDDFCSEDDLQSFPSRAKIESLQAAYICCLVQNWEGSDVSKRRIRRFRYPNMVSVARDIGIAHAKHPPYLQENYSNFAWDDFVAREELIRVFLWIFLLDTAFVIFNNLPPRMVLREMRMHLASCEAAFQAGDGATCFARLTEVPQRNRDPMSSLCEAFCKGPLDIKNLMDLADLGPLNLFVLTSALHSLIFISQQSFGYDHQMTAIRNALANWIGAWQYWTDMYATEERHCALPQTDTQVDSLWKRLGFARYAADYWMLAKLIVERISAAGYQNQDVADRGNGSEATGWRHGDPTGLDHYDDTSMRQMNDLISEFQKIIL